MAVFSVALAAAPAMAQTGSLNYGPDIAVAVPLGDPTAMTILALGLAVVAAWGLRHRRLMRLGTVSAALALAVVMQLPPTVSADIAETLLDNPQGGTVELPIGPRRFTNATGIEQRIKALTPPCADSRQFADNACSAGVSLLASGASCDTDYRCPEAEICDGTDNDLNDLIDDGVVPPEASCIGTWSCDGLAGWTCGVCTPDCDGRACGDDGCGGSCGSCANDAVCTDGLCT